MVSHQSQVHVVQFICLLVLQDFTVRRPAVYGRASRWFWMLHIVSICEINSGLCPINSRRPLSAWRWCEYWLLIRWRPAPACATPDGSWAAGRLLRLPATEHAVNHHIRNWSKQHPLRSKLDCTARQQWRANLRALHVDRPLVRCRVKATPVSCRQERARVSALLDKVRNTERH